MKKIILSFFISTVFCSSAFAVACNDDSTPGTQICKICAVGDNCTDEDYNTLQAWEDAKDGDLVTAQQIRIAEVYDDDGVITGGLVVAGSTTSADYYMKVTAPVGERHNGTRGSGATLTLTSSAVNQVVSVDDNYFKWEWVEIDASNLTREYVFGIISDGDIGTRVENILCYGENGSTGGSCIDMRGGGSIYCTVRNSVVFDNTNIGISFNGSNSSAYNNTGFNNGVGLQAANVTADLVAKNNLMINNTTDFNGTFHTTSTNNGCSDTSCPDNGGANHSFESLTAANEVVSLTEDSEDPHLKSTSTIIDDGADLGDGVANIDIDGRDRHAQDDTWDIGADEYVAAAASGLLRGMTVFFH